MSFSNPFVQTQDFDVGHWGEWNTPASFAVLRNGMNFSVDGSELVSMSGYGCAGCGAMGDNSMATNPILAPMEASIRAAVRDEVLKTFLSFFVPVGLVIGGVALYALKRTYR